MMNMPGTLAAAVLQVEAYPRVVLSPEFAPVLADVQVGTHSTYFHSLLHTHTFSI